MKKSILWYAAGILAIAGCVYSWSKKDSEDYSYVDNYYVYDDFSDSVCSEREWAYNVMQNYLLDVVDETDYWEYCDSTAFNDFEEGSPEWMLDVIIDYTKWEIEYYK